MSCLYQGELTYGKIGEWRFDKRSYTTGAPPKNMSLPPPGVPETVVSSTAFVFSVTRKQVKFSCFKTAKPLNCETRSYLNRACCVAECRLRWSRRWMKPLLIYQGGKKVHKNTLCILDNPLEMGYLLHTFSIFFSHWNWVEILSECLQDSQLQNN